MNTWTACANAWERHLPTLLAVTEMPLGQEPPSTGGILPSSGNLRQRNPLDWRGFRRTGGIRAFLETFDSFLLNALQVEEHGSPEQVTLQADRNSWGIF